MKKISYLILLLFSISNVSKAVNGLEKIIVEKYYVSNAADSIGSIGALPTGSVTYRVYVDMLPGYKFQAIYGVPTHQLRIQTSTGFFNNEDRGSTTPNWTKAQAADNTVMLDSWVTAGSACLSNFGVQKTDDNGVSNTVNNDGLLQNNDPEAGIPLTTQDGFLSGAPGAINLVNLASNIGVFANASYSGNLFSTFNGSWACLAGVAGPTADNKILVGQFTTDGVFSFELNVQIGTPSGGVQKFVARNPVGTEIKISSLIYKNIPEKLAFGLDLKVMIQGFYLGGGFMNASVDPIELPTVCDSLKLYFYDATSPYALIDSADGILNTDGNAHFKVFKTNLNSNRYLVVKHRNSIETWSADPHILVVNLYYDFTTLQSSAYGNNLILTDDANYYSMYSGDISDAGSAIVGVQDGIIESQDYGDMESAVFYTKLGYLPEDITGDRLVESADYGLMENNVYYTIVKHRP